MTTVYIHLYWYGHCEAVKTAAAISQNFINSYGKSKPLPYECILTCVGNDRCVVPIKSQQFQLCKNHRNPNIMLAGLFNKARCEFFLSDFESLRHTVNRYINTLSAFQKLNPKLRSVYLKIQKTLELLVALADDNKEKISALKDIEVWNDNKPTLGYIYYLKGIATYSLGEIDEAKYRFMYVKENCEKTILATLAEKHLRSLEKCS